MKRIKWTPEQIAQASKVVHELNLSVHSKKVIFVAGIGKFKANTVWLADRRYQKVNKYSIYNSSAIQWTNETLAVANDFFKEKGLLNWRAKNTYNKKYSIVGVGNVSPAEYVAASMRYNCKLKTVETLEQIVESEIATPITIQKAICVASEYYITNENAKDLAYFVLSFFRICEDRFVDNILSEKERDVFYTLEEKGIVKTDKEEVKLPINNRDYRLHYWLLNKENILKSSKAFQKEPKKPVLSEEARFQEMYDKIFQTIEQS